MVDNLSDTAAEHASAAGGFFEQGMAALNARREEEAYHYFSLLSETEPQNERAWYWRAKSAPTLDEVIHCLRRVVEINPVNAKAQRELESALLRRQRDQTPEVSRQEGSKPAQARPEPAKPMNGFLLALRRGLLQLAGLATFLLGLGFCLPFAVSFTDLPSSPDYAPYLKLLPDFELPVPPLLAGLAGLDLGAASGFLVGLLLLHAAFKLADGGSRRIRLWTAVLSAAAVALLVFAQAASPLSLALAVAAAALALAGDNGLAPRRAPVFRDSKL